MLQTISENHIEVYQPDLDQTTLEKIIGLVVDSLDSLASKRLYRMALTHFLDWYIAHGHPQLSAAVVKQYKAECQAAGMKAASINIRLVALRKLAVEAVDNAILDERYLAGIQRVKSMRAFVTRMGNWLSKEDAERLINAPDLNTTKGIRDRAVLALLIGCGLRRTECVNLEFGHIQFRDGRWVVLDMAGKGNKIRTVPIPPWAKVAVDNWAMKARLSTGRIFRELSRGGRIIRDEITPQGIRNIVNKYGNMLSLDIAPHDCRRTFAKLAHKGGAGLEQIQLTLGHASLTTTERYLGIRQSLTDAPCDHLGLHI
jgi:site-specific recombinase XerD